MERRRALAAGALLLLPAVASCRSRRATGDRITLNGAGATLPYPLYSKWIAEYQRLVPEVRVNYQALGSGAALRQLVAGTVDFGTSELPASTRSDIANIPASVGAIAIAVNLPQVRVPLQLEPQVLGAVFRGHVRRWSDPAIAHSNPQAKLPDQDINVVHRTDGSGTTAVFTGYLASVDPEFAKVVGVGNSLRWPTGLGAKGNEGVAGQVKNTVGTFTYVLTREEPPDLVKGRALARFIWWITHEGQR